MKTARQIKSLYLSGDISFRAAHTALRAIGYTDTEADDILWDTPCKTIQTIIPASTKKC